MNSRERLIKTIKQIAPFKPHSWLNSLEERKHDEICLHNQIRDVSGAKEVTADAENKKFYSITERSSGYIDGFLKRTVKDKIFLDFACGNGCAAIACAQQGALLSVGLDISDVSVKNAKQAVKAFPEEISKRLFFYQGDCEDTNLPSSSIDIVLCSGMLHHLNLEKAYAELSRIIVPGGLIVGIEALGHNPFFQAYRDLTPHLRTRWEASHIMKIEDILKAVDFGFDILEMKFWHFFELLAVPFRGRREFKWVQALGFSIDQLFFRLPFCKKLAWQVSFVLRKHG